MRPSALSSSGAPAPNADTRAVTPKLGVNHTCASPPYAAKIAPSRLLPPPMKSSDPRIHTVESGFGWYSMTGAVGVKVCAVDARSAHVNASNAAPAAKSAEILADSGRPVIAPTTVQEACLLADDLARAYA